MTYAKLQRRLGADEIRAAMQDKPRRKWHWQKVLLNLLMVAGVLVLLWMAATDLLGPAIDHELDRMHPGGQGYACAARAASWDFLRTS